MYIYMMNLYKIYMKYGMSMLPTVMPIPGHARLQHGRLITADKDCTAHNHVWYIYMRILMNGKKRSGTHGVITFMKENLLNLMWSAPHLLTAQKTQQGMS